MNNQAAEDGQVNGTSSGHAMVASIPSGVGGTQQLSTYGENVTTSLADSRAASAQPPVIWNISVQSGASFSLQNGCTSNSYVTDNSTNTNNAYNKDKAYSDLKEISDKVNELKQALHSEHEKTRSRIDKMENRIEELERERKRNMKDLFTQSKGTRSMSKVPSFDEHVQLDMAAVSNNAAETPQRKNDSKASVVPSSTERTKKQICHDFCELMKTMSVNDVFEIIKETANVEEVEVGDASPFLERFKFHVQLATCLAIEQATGKMILPKFSKIKLDQLIEENEGKELYELMLDNAYEFKGCLVAMTYCSFAVPSVTAEIGRLGTFQDPPFNAEYNLFLEYPGLKDIELSFLAVSEAEVKYPLGLVLSTIAKSDKLLKCRYERLDDRVEKPKCAIEAEALTCISGKNNLILELEKCMINVGQLKALSVAKCFTRLTKCEISPDDLSELTCRSWKVVFQQLCPSLDNLEKAISSRVFDVLIIYGIDIAKQYENNEEKAVSGLRGLMQAAKNAKCDIRFSRLMFSNVFIADIDAFNFIPRDVFLGDDTGLVEKYIRSVMSEDVEFFEDGKNSKKDAELLFENGKNRVELLLPDKNMVRFTGYGQSGTTFEKPVGEKMKCREETKCESYELGRDGYLTYYFRDNKMTRRQLPKTATKDKLYCVKCANDINDQHAS